MNYTSTSKYYWQLHPLRIQLFRLEAVVYSSPLVFWNTYNTTQVLFYAMRHVLLDFSLFKSVAWLCCVLQLWSDVFFQCQLMILVFARLFFLLCYSRRSWMSSQRPMHRCGNTMPSRQFFLEPKHKVRKDSYDDVSCFTFNFNYLVLHLWTIVYFIISGCVVQSKMERNSGSFQLLAGATTAPCCV